MEAMNRAAEFDGYIDNFEYRLAGNAAWAADGFSEEEWFDNLPSNKGIQFNLQDNQILPSETYSRLAKSISVLKSFDLWPWP